MRVDEVGNLIVVDGMLGIGLLFYIVNFLTCCCSVLFSTCRQTGIVLSVFNLFFCQLFIPMFFYVIVLCTETWDDERRSLVQFCVFHRDLK